MNTPFLVARLLGGCNQPIVAQLVVHDSAISAFIDKLHLAALISTADTLSPPPLPGTHGTRCTHPV